MRPNGYSPLWILPALIAALTCARAQPPAAGVVEREFGKMPDGTVVKQFDLRNARGMLVKVMSYGAIITEVDVPDRAGAMTNVVLGAPTFDKYISGFGTSAAAIGRVANRIAGARFTLDGVEYQLTANNGTNTLHGGRRGFASVVWQGQALPPKPGAASVRFTYVSKDGEGGFPGNLTVNITYTVTDDNDLQIDYEAVTDKATILNLTNHGYYNLSGGGDLSAQQLWLACDHYTVADASLIPTGEIASVAGTPLDFTTPTSLTSRVGELKAPAGVYDHNFIINGGGESLVLAARVVDTKSGRVMELRTTEPALQLYTGGPNAFCLETQHYPDSIHHANFPSTVLRPGETFKSTTRYSYSVAPPKQPTLRWGELPVGMLGFPVGSYLTIEGTRTDGMKTGERTLLVDTVNGVKLAEPFGIWIENIDSLPYGRCVLKGYETLRMIGPPPAYFAAAKEAGREDTTTTPQAGWQVDWYFVATSVVSPDGVKINP
jgi:aldose 1-epimerase